MSFIIGKSVRGASHINRDQPLEDWFCICQMNDVQGEYDIIAVADGHGSDKYPYSADGSRIATHTFCEYMERYIAAYNTEDLRLYLHSHKLDFAKHLVIEWQKGVFDFHKKEEREFEGESDPFNKNIFSQYGTTLLGLMVAPTFLYVFQVGDGNITYVDDRGACELIKGDRLLGVETHSLSSDEAYRKAKSVVLNGRSEGSHTYLLSTDGFINSYEDDASFYRICENYHAMFKTNRSDEIKNGLKDWLDNVSLNGSGDDITTVFAHYGDDLKNIDSEEVNK